MVNRQRSTMLAGCQYRLGAISIAWPSVDNKMYNVLTLLHLLEIVECYVFIRAQGACTGLGYKVEGAIPLYL